MSKKNYKETYFQHDRYARQDPKIKSMLVHFRQISEDKAKAAVCIFWWIIEDMHIDDYPINKLDVFADDYRCDVNFLKSILEDFDLFRIQNDCYVSDRVLRNLKEQEEKSEKARAKAAKRWNKGENPEPEQIVQEIDDELVNSIIQIYNKEFKKTQIIGKENREKIFKITKENKLTLEIWQKVFSNARRGWDIKGEHKKPNLKNILDNWDAFASDDYYLAPDYEAMEADKQAQKEAEEKAKEDVRIQIQKEQEEIEKEKSEICDAASAIKFLNKHNRLPAAFLHNSNTVKEYMTKYGFTIEELLAARGDE